MDMAIGIFKQLGVDASVFPLFAVMLGMFFILKPLFFKRLQFVLELREEKTTKLAGHASETLGKAERLSEAYRRKIDGAYEQAAANFTDKKVAIIEREKQKIKEVESRVDSHIEEKRAEAEKEVALKQSRILEEVDSLATDLVKKFTH